MIRPAAEADAEAIGQVAAAAFGRTDEADLVARLRRDGDVTAELVAAAKGRVFGHILFSRLELIGDHDTLTAAALAPVSVAPAEQGQGHGAALVRAGLDLCRSRGLSAVVVLGHPNYYPRFGFEASAAAKLQAPFSGPAFMALELRPGALAEARRVRYARAFGLNDPSGTAA